MTAEDSVYIPFLETTLRQIRSISTIDLITYYKNGMIGCGKVKCPCRVWQQCRYYNNRKWKDSRGEEDEHMKAIWKYYNNIFRITYDMPMVNMNG